MTEFREFQKDALVPGTRYRVVDLIGEGGMGSVFEVEHVELGKRFVLKALLRDLMHRDDLVARLRNEWRALARLQHPNIVNVTDAGTTTTGVPFFVMERLEGETLTQRLRKNCNLPIPEALAIAGGVLEGLSAAHEIGVIHRDVKPPNVFLVGALGVRLLDFGVAKIADANVVVTARGLAVGTPRYMSPEQVRGERVDGRSDIYAVGLLLFEMIAGTGPFDDARDANELLGAHLTRRAPRLSAFALGVAPELDAFVASMLAKDRAERPPTARGGALALRDFRARYQRADASGVSTVPYSELLRTHSDGKTKSRTTLPTGTALGVTSLSGALLLDFDDLRARPDAFEPAVPSSRSRDSIHEQPTSRGGIERHEPTEVIHGELAAMPGEPALTRTSIPADAPQHNSTPPPVVDSRRWDRSDGRQRKRVALGLTLGFLGLAVSAGLALRQRRAAWPSPPVAAHLANAPVSVAQVSTPLAAPPTPALPLPAVQSSGTVAPTVESGMGAPLPTSARRDAAGRAASPSKRPISKSKPPVPSLVLPGSGL